MNTLYLECYSGISGDMTVGALLDLGADREGLERLLESLGVDGYRLHFGRTEKCGIDAYDFDVELEEEHAQEEAGGHGHVHRHIGDIYEIIDRMKAEDSVKELAREIFGIVAAAESKAHGIPVEEVHFHEVGAIDSIVDIVSTAYCIRNLKIDKVILSPLSEGRGFVRCQHGVIPVPVPATVNIAAAYGLSLRLTDNEGEMVTPTGAAIAAALSRKERLPENYRILRVGIGAGKKEFKNANILRAVLIEPDHGDTDEMWVLESNIDDCSGEALGHTMECLMDAGAADVWFTPVYMKKNRPACLLSVMCRQEQAEQFEDIIFAHTSTIGVRRYPVNRTVMNREVRTVSTGYGEARVKVCTHEGKTSCYPEYESVRGICENSQAGFLPVYHTVLECAADQIEPPDDDSKKE